MAVVITVTIETATRAGSSRYSWRAMLVAYPTAGTIVTLSATESAMRSTPSIRPHHERDRSVPGGHVRLIDLAPETARRRRRIRERRGRTRARSGTRRAVPRTTGTNAVPLTQNGRDERCGEVRRGRRTSRGRSARIEDGSTIVPYLVRVSAKSRPTVVTANRTELSTGLDGNLVLPPHIG